MKHFLTILLGFSLFFVCLQAKAEIISFDYTDSPFNVSVTANDGAGEQNGTLYFSTEGVSAASGELEIYLTASADKRGRAFESTIALGNSFARVSEFDTIGLETNFSEQPEELISVTRRGQSDIYNDYIALRFSNGDGSSLFGWAEIVANVSVGANGKQALADISVNRFAFNSTAGESILAGDIGPAIPEPASAALVLGAGISLLAGRRIFMK